MGTLADQSIGMGDFTPLASKNSPPSCNHQRAWLGCEECPEMQPQLLGAVFFQVLHPAASVSVAQIHRANESPIRSFHDRPACMYAVHALHAFFESAVCKGYHAFRKWYESLFFCRLGEGIKIYWWFSIASRLLRETSQDLSCNTRCYIIPATDHDSFVQSAKKCKKTIQRPEGHGPRSVEVKHSWACCFLIHRARIQDFDFQACAHESESLCVFYCVPLHVVLRRSC